jgi:hypothetical protein
MRMKKHLLSFLLLTACATIPKAEQVQIRAAYDFKCDSDQIQATAIDKSTVRASGCGHEAVYREDCVTDGTTRCTWIAERASKAETTAKP